MLQIALARYWVATDKTTSRQPAQFAGSDSKNSPSMTQQQQQKNSSELWDGIWGNTSLQHREILYTIEREKRDSIWPQIRKAVIDRHGSFKGLQVLELGAGAGTFAALMAQEGAGVTILDYSANAINRSQLFFDSLGMEAAFFQDNALTVRDSLTKKYDISMSFGLAEHFQDGERIQIIRSHFEVLNETGMTFISVPNRFCLPYRFWKKKRELQGRWAYGEEYPFSRRELRNICIDFGIKNYSFTGSSTLASLEYIIPLASWRNSIQKRLQPTALDPLDISKIKSRKTRFADEFLGYALILNAQI